MIFSITITFLSGNTQECLGGYFGQHLHFGGPGVCLQHVTRQRSWAGNDLTSKNHDLMILIVIFMLIQWWFIYGMICENCPNSLLLAFEKFFLKWVSGSVQVVVSGHVRPSRCLRDEFVSQSGWWCSPLQMFFVFCFPLPSGNLT